MRGALGLCNKGSCTCPLLLLEPGKLQTDLGFAFSGRFLTETQPPTSPGSREAQEPGNCIQGFIRCFARLTRSSVKFLMTWECKEEGLFLDRTTQSTEMLSKREFDF